jgi:hypothetical protein
VSFDKMQRVFSQEDIRRAKANHAELKENEHIFFRIGEVLTEQRDKELYGIYADTFEEYVNNVLGWSRQRAYQFMSATEVVKSLPEKCQPLVDTERKARALGAIPEEQRATVLRHVQKNGAVTAKSIAQAAEKLPEPPAPAPKPEPPPKPDVVLDHTGYVVPESRVVLFNRTDEVEDLLRRIASVRGALRRAQDNNDILFKPINISMTLTELDKAYSEIKTAVPFVVCPYCQGQVADHCVPCKGRGVMSEFMWKTAVPSDLRSVREKSCVKK